MAPSSITSVSQSLILHRALRTLAHAVVILTAMHILKPVLGRAPLPAMLVGFAQPYEFLPWSLGVAAGLNNNSIILTILAVTTVLAGFPNNVLPSAIAAFFGTIVGASIRTLIIKEKTDG